MTFLFEQSFIGYLSQPWPWYIAGILIASVMVFLLFTGKHFGVSATLRAGCSALGAGKLSDFFHFDWKKAQGWNLLFILGGLIGGYIASTFLASPEPMEIGERTAEHIQSMGFSLPAASKDKISGMLPAEFTDTEFIFSLKGMSLLILGGFFVGFGTRYAGGCTSGHAISGLSALQLPSLIAVIGFFIGGLTMTYLLMPLFF
jgi:uncharacterized membrane protein YedE/YeeE